MTRQKNSKYYYTGIYILALHLFIIYFLFKVRRQDGQEYPAESLRQLCISIWRYLRDTCRRYDLNMCDKTKAEFADARECFDSKMKTCNSGGCYFKKQAEPISAEEEAVLWERVFQNGDSQSLQFAVYFYACKLFGLRAAGEHSDLNVDQFPFWRRRGRNICTIYRRYIENSSRWT